MNADSAPAEDAAPREETEADREYKRKLDRDLRIMRAVLPPLTILACALIIALTAYLIVTKL